MGKETVTYVTYREGIDAKHLYLGNITHDPKFPKFYEPFVDKTYTDIADETPQWAQLSTLDNFALTVGQDSDSPEKYQVVAAAKATKLELKDPARFFSSTTLSSATAKKWLTFRISATELLDSSLPKPEIWLLTGLVLLQHATWTSISTTKDQSIAFTPGLQAPFDPTGVSNLRRLSVSDNVRPVVGHKDEPKKHISGAEIIETGKYPGLRGWAARWEKVDWQVKDGKEWTDAPNHLKLRLEEGVRKFAVVNLKAGQYAENKFVDDDRFNDKFWEEFLDDAEDED